MSPLAAIFLAVGGLVLLGGLIRTVQDPRNAWILLVGMLLCAGMAPQVSATGGTTNTTWALFLQTNRAELYLAIACLMFVAMLVHVGKISLTTVPVQGALLILIQLITSLLRFNHDGPAEGAKSLVFTIVTMLPIVTLLPLALKNWEDWIVVIRLVAFAALVWAGAVLLQVVIDHRQLQVNWAGRFTGLLGNPQGCGLYMAPMTFCLVWLVMNEVNRKLWFVWVGTLALMSMYSLWTGSRTCILVTGVGMLFVLYSRVGRLILFAPILGGVLYATYEIALAAGVLSANAVDRLGSTQNTRATVWTWLLEDAMANPILGSGFSNTRANENSYLLAFAAYGVFCGAAVLILLFYSISLMFKLVRARGLLPAKHRQLVDLILGFNAAYFTGAMFEWHIVSRLEGNIPYMLIFSVVAKQLLDKVNNETSLQQLYAQDLEEYGNAYGMPHHELDEPASA